MRTRDEKIGLEVFEGLLIDVENSRISILACAAVEPKGEMSHATVYRNTVYYFPSNISKQKP